MFSNRMRRRRSLHIKYLEINRAKFNIAADVLGLGATKMIHSHEYIYTFKTLKFPQLILNYY